MLLVVVSSFAQSGFNSLGVISNTNFYPTLFWGFMALLFLIAQLINKNGMVYFFWGKRLGLDNVFWRNLSIANIIFFVALALVALIVYAISSAQVWAYYKLIVQPLMLFAVPLVYTRKLSTHGKT